MAVIRGLIRLIGFIIKWILESIIFLALFGACVFVYARYIEPKLLVVHEETLAYSNKGTNIKPLTLVQFSDTHLGKDYTLEDFDRVIDKINENNPDIIVFTGDLIDSHAEDNDAEAIIARLKRLQSKRCKVAVYGNHDHGANGTKRYQKIMKAAGFTLLTNANQTVDLGNGQKMNMMGIDDVLLGKPDIKKATQTIKAKDYNLLIVHEPDIADELKAYPIDLQLSGHSHGGQVALPFIGALITPPYADKYVKGMYNIAGNDRMKLYVNSGIGTSNAKYRLLNTPQITVFHLEFK
jgi:predicted MPP superfamily phosphohydrolase